MPDEQERWMTVAEVAEYLHLSRSKIYDLAQNGEIPCSKLAGQWRFRRSEIDEWMISARRSSNSKKPSRGDSS